ncbi:hypothetical protein TrLO_g13365 [Triparma laevis f. longispina]|uniref:Uncharacterized protein n=1 Tax=Triparma laevis f. longispina TaxID=1714387 RepID=A0A9W7FHY7_9STRA|nr:hypothetical protein TrLO_g13365 [Triparma laevis f. longispina]
MRFLVCANRGRTPLASYVCFFLFVILVYFAGVGDAYYHASKQLLSDTEFVSAVFLECEGKGGGAEGTRGGDFGGGKECGTLRLDFWERWSWITTL